MSDAPSLFDVPQSADGFEAFWQVFPRRVAKIAARKAWLKLNPSPALVAKIVDAVIDQCSWPTWTKDGGEYVPYPATWINRGQWDDEPPPMCARRASRVLGMTSCDHTPRCATFTACRDRYLAEAKRDSA